MPRFRYFPGRVLFFVVLILAASAALAATIHPTGTSVPGEVLVKIRTDASQNEVAGIEHLADADQGERVATVKSGHIVRLHSRSKNVDALITALSKNPNIEYVEPNYLLHLVATPNDTSFGQLWGLRNTGQVIGGVAGIAGADISAEGAWNVTTGSASIVVGVVDTGIDYNHPDLAANVWSNPGGKGNAICAAGTHGFNAITKTCNPMDDHYHGTHVSGTIGGVGNNSLGVAGVNWTTSIMGLKFLDWDGGGTTADAIAAIDFAVQAKIDGVNVRVLSNSWGGGGFSKALLDEINKANENDILFVASSGNDYSNNDTYPHYPSSYATPNMIAVAATDNRDALAYFSNIGPTTVHLGAPGLNVYSTMPGGSYGSLSGTSMAAPHVSGVAALVLAQHPAYTTAQVKAAILDNTDPISSLQGKVITNGRLNAARALGVPAGPDFTLSISPASRTVLQGGSTTYTVTITPTNGFSGDVALSITGLPAGATGSFTPTPATTNSTLSITTSAATPVSNNTPIITASGAGKSHSAVATLIVTAPPVFIPCPTLSFVTRVDSGTPTALLTADFNRDGKADLASTNVSTNNVSVVLGNGNGFFQSSVKFAVGTAPLSLAGADFNGDGRIDLVTANSGSNNVSILIGNGDGTFLAATHVPAGTSPFAVTTGDFNNDGKTDVAVANNGSSNVSILLGAGDGTFQAAVNYAAASGPFSIAAADLNRDGAADLAVAAYNVSKVAVLRGNGDGTFQAAVTYSAGGGTAAVAAGDVNGDGKIDLATANFSTNNVSILLGNGDGTLQAATNLAAGTAPYSVTVGDLTNDGKADLTTANSESDNISLMVGNGDGTFQAAITYASDYYYYGGPNQTVLGDFNGDGKTDVAVANQYSGMAVLLNTGSCTLNCNIMLGAVQYSAGTTPNALAAGDFNRDGVPDLAVVNSGANTVSIELGNVDGTFIAGVNAGVGTAPGSVAAGDFDADGKLDLAVGNSGSNNVSILRGNGDGTFQAAVHYDAGTSPQAVAIGDFDRDGRADLAVANSGTNNVSVLRGNGNATFQAAVDYGAGTSPHGLAVGDFNRDGILDLATANFGSGNVSLLAGNAAGTFQAAVNFGVGSGPYAIVSGDFNRDGKADLAAANSGSNNVSVLLGNGNATFQTAVQYAAGVNPVGLTVADFNADGKSDLAAANYNSHNVSVLIGAGDGSFDTPGNQSSGTGAAAVASGDFNRDGKPDLAVANSGAGTFSILLTACPLPDLVVSKSHAGNFTQGAIGATYTITVTNNGAATTSGLVTVTDTLPLGLTATAIGGSGWTCTLASLTCTRGDALAGGAGYPAITLTVNVGSGAGTNVLNVVNVSGGGEIYTLNNSASDSAAVTQITDLIVTSSHSGSFTQGATGRIYTLVARNAGGLATSGTVTVVDTLPTGLTATAISGSGWSCTLGSLTCTRSDSLAARTNYPPITLTVNVSASAAPSVVNTVTVSGGSESNTANDTSADLTVVWNSETCGSFGAPVLYTTGSDPVAVAARDFNGDGKVDLAVVNNYSNSVSVLLGNGDGTFQAAVNYNVGSYPTGLGLADLNNDGKTDILVVVTYSYGVVVLLGNGNGTFAPAVAYVAHAGSYPNSLATGDFNGDGNVDAAVTAGSLFVLLGNGNGSLQPGVEYATGTSLNYVTAAELNGDSKLDLIISSYYNAKVSVMLGNGDGTFQPPANQISIYDPNYVSVGDFNGDGNTDAAVTTYYDSNVKILMGAGNGTFAAPVTYPSVYGSYSSTIDDVNGDGKLDILVANGGSNGISVLRGNGDGTFQPYTFFNVGSGPYQVVVSDFNGDGKADLAAALRYSGKLGILMNGCPDLTLTKTHSGTFYSGQTGYYGLRVGNSGMGNSAGQISVTDALPAGLTAVSMYGYGWTCTLATLTCTTTNSVTSGGYLDYINVVVNIAPSAPASITNTATVTGGGDTNNANNSASDTTTVQQAPDLVVTKSHSGNFVQGQNATYTITVGNTGGGSTSGAVTVNDYLPSSMSVTSMSGAGWTCQNANATCTRSDALAFGATYPPITLTVSVSVNALQAVTNTAYVSGGGEPSLTSYNNSFYDFTQILTKPTLVTAAAVSTSAVNVTWSPVAYASGYQVLRSSNNGPFVVVGTPTFNVFVDTTVAPNTAYLYQVKSTDGVSLSPASLIDLATTVMFTDDPLVAGTTRSKAAHITELRTAVNAVRALAGLAPAAFTDPALGDGSPVRAVHIIELRTALVEARNALYLDGINFLDPLTSTTRLKAVHVQQLRSAVK